MHRRPRVLQVGPVPPPIGGGISAYLDGLMRSSVARQFEMIAFDTQVPAWAKRWRPLRACASARFLGRFIGALRETKPDIVHIHSSAFLSFWEKTTLGHLAERQQIPWILHLHDGFFEPFLANMGNPLAILARQRIRSAAGVITVCDGWRQWLHDWVPPQRLHAIANAIHVADFPAARGDANPTRLLFVGDLTTAKGIEDLAAALGNLRSAGLQFECDLVGGATSPAHLHALRRRFAALGLASCCHFHGPLYNSDKAHLLEHASVFVLPSHTESFCLANLEAMACGLPVISTHTGAIPEVVRDGQEGLLVDPGNVAALQQAIATLILDPEKRLRMGAAAQRRAQHFDWQSVETKLAALYDSVLGKPRTAESQPQSTTLTVSAAL